MHRTFCQLLTTAAVLLAGAGVARAQDAPAGRAGTIVGRVTDRASGQPLGDARVVLIGTQRDVRTKVDVSLAAAVTRLDQVTISATGESERRRETGNSIAAITVDSVPTVIVSGVNDLLSSRAANVTVTQTSGTCGTGSRIRIRGSNSVSLSNEPLVIIDGIRSVSDALGSTISVGGQNPTRLDDLNPDDIENIEIIKGPAAAALYGTAAANGVVQITTKRGKSGRTR